MSKHSLQSLLAQKSWANNELFNVLATVAAEPHAVPVHAAIRTLNHIYVVDHTRGVSPGECRPDPQVHFCVSPA